MPSCAPSQERSARGGRWLQLLLCAPLIAFAIAAVLANVAPGPGPAPFAVPQAPADDAALAVAAWRLDPSPEWGSPASLDMLLLSRRAITSEEDVVVRLRRAGSGGWVERRQGPRMGAVSTRGWPPNLLLEDHALVPGPRDLCPGKYEVQVGFAIHGRRDVQSTQGLGVVDVPGEGGACSPLETDASPPTAAAVAGFSVDGQGGGTGRALVPGRDLSVQVDLRALAPTDGDDAITVQLLDNLGHVVVQRDSYANVDLAFTSIWRPGDRVSLVYQLPVPADLPVGLYRLEAGLYSGSRAGFDPLVGPGGLQASPALVPLTPFKVRPSGPAPQRANVSFGGLFGLQGVTIDDGHPTAAPGAMAPVDMLWQSLAPAHDDYTLFVQMLDPSGRLVAQQDGPPLGGRYPTSAWEPGDVVDEHRSIVLPAGLAPGAYSIVVGWYAQPSGQRLPTIPAHPDRAVPVGTLLVAG